MRRGAAAVASLSEMRRLIKLRKGTGVAALALEKLPEMKARILSSKELKVGHGVIRVHPKVYEKLLLEEKIMKEFNDKIEKDKVVNNLSTLVMAVTAIHAPFVAYGLFDRARKTGVSNASMERMVMEKKIIEKLNKERISRVLEEMDESIQELRLWAETNETIAGQADDSSAREERPQLLNWIFNLVSRLWNKKM